jgi:hypothetical protein
VDLALFAAGLGAALAAGAVTAAAQQPRPTAKDRADARLYIAANTKSVAEGTKLRRAHPELNEPAKACQDRGERDPNRLRLDAHASPPADRVHCNNAADRTLQPRPQRGARARSQPPRVFGISREQAQAFVDQA